MPETAARERPILFSDGMVRAILEGKTQTRRVVLPQPCNPQTFGTSPVWGQGPVLNVAKDPPQRGYMLHAAFNENGQRVDRKLFCPFGGAGGRVWVRETWQADMSFPRAAHMKARWWNETPPAFRSREHVGYVYYRADGTVAHPAVADEESGEVLPLEVRVVDGKLCSVRRWLPSIHMPRWASRITLEITDVRAQRVQEISEEDAQAEGAPTHITGVPKYGSIQFANARVAFQFLWDSLNAARGFGWDTNPWVWAITFKRVEG